MKKGNTTRPIKFSLSNSDRVDQVLRKARLLRTKEGFESVCVLLGDRSVDERRAYKKILEELKMQLEEELD